MDDIEDSKKALFSSRPHNRIRAIRKLAADPSKSSQGLLLKALSEENNLWVKVAIESTLEAWDQSDNFKKLKATEKGSLPSQLFLSFDDDDQLISTSLIKQEALHEITATLTHELMPIVGILEVYASQEVPAYAESKSKLEIDKLKRFLKAVSYLQGAAKVAEYSEYSLLNLVTEFINAEPQFRDNFPSFANPDDLIVRADKTLLNMAFRNGLKNAYEANNEAGANAQKVIINWGRGRTNFWISIIDNGAGLKKLSENLYDVGKTSKQNHLGMGLPIARQAMQSMEGDIELTTGKSGGARFVMSWPIK